MSGHSKWSTIKRQKGANDAKRGQAFTKAGNAITVAAREGGGNTETNFKLRLAVDAARAVNMPKENIERAIARASGAGDGKALEEVVYEGYGPSGVAVMIEAVTDNKVRTASEVRSVLERSGGSLAGPGSVAFLFKSVAALDVKGKNADEIMLAAAEAGADDVEESGEVVTVYTSQDELERIKKALTEQGLEIARWEVTKEASSQVKIEERGKAESVINLVNKLEEVVDVQKVYANFDIEEKILEEVA